MRLLVVRLDAARKQAIRCAENELSGCNGCKKKSAGHRHGKCRGHAPRRPMCCSGHKREPITTIPSTGMTIINSVLVLTNNEGQKKLNKERHTVSPRLVMQQQGNTKFRLHSQSSSSGRGTRDTPASRWTDSGRRRQRPCPEFYLLCSRRSWRRWSGVERWAAWLEPLVNFSSVWQWSFTLDLVQMYWS